MNAAETSCPICGGWLAKDATSAVCAACALQGLIDQAETQERIGAYRLIDELGRGGMGVVWLAEQESPIQREVALKVIKAGMDTREVIARFDAERQALALMDHPGIARVLDAGVTEAGRPFFVMELVEGLPLTTFCDQERLTVKERLRLLLRICEAVQHAHQKGIIHRDLKPSNILVSRAANGEPMPKVIDFGIAKAVGPQAIADTLVTQMGQIVGTPQYMSPEQASAGAQDADTRADVYALGVMLYELLTGSTPLRPETLRGAALAEVQRLVREAATERPSLRLLKMGREGKNSDGRDSGRMPELPGLAERRGTTLGRLVAGVRGDLDWIVLKALEKERDRRYGSVTALAEDLQRHLADEPVLARPPSALYWLRKTARRHRSAFATGMAVAAALVIATVVSVKAAFRARAAEKLANERLAGAEAVPEFLIQALRSPDPSKNGREVKVVEVLDQAVAEARTRFASQPLMRARLLETLGQTYHGLGLYAEAAALLGETAASYVEPNQDERGSEVKNLIARAISERFQGRYDIALALNDDAWKKAKASLGENHADTLHARYECALNLAFTGQLDEAAKIQEEIRSGQAGVAAQRQHMVEDLEVVFMEARGDLEPLVPMFTRRAQRPLYLGKRAHNELASSQMEHLGRVLEKLGRQEESLLVREELLLHTWESLGPGHSYTGLAMSILAQALFEAGRGMEATVAAKLLLADSERQNQVSSVVTRLRTHVEEWSNGFSDRQKETFESWESGSTDDAESVPALLWTVRALITEDLEQKRDHLEKAFAARQRERTESFYQMGSRLRLARLELAAGDFDAAEKRVIAMLEDEQAASHLLAPVLLHALHDLADARGGKQALRLREQAFNLAMAGSWPESPHVRELHQGMLDAASKAGQLKQTKRWLTVAGPAMAANADATAIDQLQSALGMALLLAEQGDQDAAVQTLEKLVDKLMLPDAPDDPKRIGLEMETLRLWASLETGPSKQGSQRLARRLREHCAAALTALQEKRSAKAVVLVNLVLPAAALASELDARLPKSNDELELLILLKRMGVDLYHFNRSHRPLTKALFETLLRQVEPKNDHPALRDICHFLASIYREEKRFAEALRLQQLLEPYLIRKFDETHPHRITNAQQIAECLFQIGHKERSLEVLSQCLNMMEQGLGKDHRETMNCRETLVGRLAAAGQKEEALALNLEQMQLALTTPGKHSGSYAMALVKESNILRDLGQWERARLGYLKALDQTPLEAVNEAERARIQNIIRSAINGLESVAKQAGLPFERPEEPIVKLKAMSKAKK